MLAACILAFSTGFLSLSMEILWVRLFGYTNHSVPQGFAFVLIAFLIGIAIGARLGKWFCDRRDNLWRVCGITLLVSSACDVVAPWLYAEVAHSEWQLSIGALMIALTGLLKSIAFPIAHHLGAPQTSHHIGRSVSRVYVSNILGATIGPLFTGIVILSMFSTQQGFIICAGLTFLVAVYCFSLLKSSRVWLGGLVAIVAVVFALSFSFNKHWLIEKVAEGGDLVRVIENQYGIITVYHEQQGGDIIAGGNVYDGRTNLDPIVNSNGISRVIILSALQDQPRRILMIGLSVGSWLKIITSFPEVEDIDVIEINPGYLDVISYYPAQASALLDPRVHLHIDDARRWLKLHPEEKYDLVVMNTTYHWRAYTGNLLSIEFLRLLKLHMNDNAVLAYNATESPDALKTAGAIFSDAYLYRNFVIAADFDWRKKLQAPAAAKKLAALRLDGKLLFPSGSSAVISGYLNRPTIALSTIEEFYHAAGRKVEIVTDRNLITEYKYGKSL